MLLSGRSSSRTMDVCIGKGCESEWSKRYSFWWRMFWNVRCLTFPCVTFWESWVSISHCLSLASCRFVLLAVFQKAAATAWVVWSRADRISVIAGRQTGITNVSVLQDNAVAARSFLHGLQLWILFILDTVRCYTYLRGVDARRRRDGGVWFPHLIQKSRRIART